MSFFELLKAFKRPSRLTNSSPGNAGNSILESPISKTSQGSMPPNPYKFMPPAINVHACDTHTASLPAEPLHLILLNATENPGPGSCKAD